MQINEAHDRVWLIVVALAERQYDKAELMLGDFFDELGKIRYATDPEAE